MQKMPQQLDFTNLVRSGDNLNVIKKRNTPSDFYESIKRNYYENRLFIPNNLILSLISRGL